MRRSRPDPDGAASGSGRRAPGTGARAAWAAAWAAALAAGCGPARDGAADASDAVAGGDAGRRPDIVLYLVDTLRADHLGCYGYERDTSPFLDALAEEAAVFELAQSQAPWTLPSVVSLLTSSHPVSHGVVSAMQRAAPEVETLAEFLRGQGYATAGFVYNKLGGSLGGLDQGYDHLHEPPQMKHMTDEDRARGVNTLRPFFEWIDGQPAPGDDAPLFVYIHTVEPHWPYEGTVRDRTPFTDASQERRDRLNALIPEHRAAYGEQDAASLAGEARERYERLTAELLAELPTITALYDGDVLRADEHVGRVIAALRRAGRWDDTVLIVLSDHGEELFEHGAWFHDQSLYQELVRVPLLVRVPGLTDGGRRVAEPVELVDLGPTLADLLGAAPPEAWQGRSLLPALRGEPFPPRPAVSQRFNVDRPVATTRALRGDREMALLEGGLKLIDHRDVGRASLFDVAQDPRERDDLADRRPEDVLRLAARLQEWLRDLARRPFPRPAEVGLDSEMLDQLEQLGY